MSVEAGKVNAGNEVFVKAITQFDDINKSEAEFLIPLVTKFISTGKSDKQVADYIASLTRYEPGWDGSWKYDAVQQWIDNTRLLQSEAKDEYSRTSTKGVKTPSVNDEKTVTAKAKSTIEKVGIFPAIAGFVGLVFVYKRFFK